MALQHFYSRVPARVSMYHKADGFDTFAHSAGLEQNFVERELVPLCENKLGKIDTIMIRQNKMPCVYFQTTTRTGAMVQSCISYLPVDYTGERSAYLSHMLILSEEEKKQVLATKNPDALNPGLFVHDISGFSITATDAVPIREYPGMDYTPCRWNGESYMLSRLPEETVKSFLYAVLYCVCGKGRNVCFKLPGKDQELSRLSVQLFNELLSIFPCQLRSVLSFASYVTEPTQHSNCKLRGISEAFPENASKGVCIDFETNSIVGVQHNEVVANKELINFFYLLLDNPQLRGAFLEFMERAAGEMSGLQSLNMKALGNLVFLFQCSSGLFPEQEVLPNDTTVFDYLCNYEKYRDVLPEIYRIQGYRSLLRYPENHRAIPKNIFAKVSRLYGAESCAVKQIVMDIALELIHTDAMRDKLFTFIRNNYQDEEETRKQVIMTDLSRVFYGGFLQSQLLNFFSEQFAGEPEKSQSLILEKLLLSIRTPAVQGKILGFIDQHYHVLSESLKDRFYQTYLEMLPECDVLTDLMIQVANKHLAGETEERKEKITQAILPILEADCRRKERSLMPLLANYPGFSQDLVIRQVFGPWRAWKVRDDFITFLGTKGIVEKTCTLNRIYALFPDLNLDSLLPEAVSLYQSDMETGNLQLWLQVAEQIQMLPEAVADALYAAVTDPAVARSAYEVFGASRETEALLEDYAVRHPEVRESEQYRLIETYHRAVTAAINLDYPELECQLLLLCQHPERLSSMAAHLQERECQNSSQTGEAALCLEILHSLLKDGTANLGSLYRKCMESRDPEQAMVLLLSVLVPMSEAGPTLLAALTSDAGAKAFVAAFVNGYGKGAYHRLHQELPKGTAFGGVLEKAILEHKKANGSFLSKLFGKK